MIKAIHLEPPEPGRPSLRTSGNVRIGMRWFSAICELVRTTPGELEQVIQRVIAMIKFDDDGCFACRALQVQPYRCLIMPGG